MPDFTLLAQTAKVYAVKLEAVGKNLIMWLEQVDVVDPLINDTTFVFGIAITIKLVG